MNKISNFVYKLGMMDRFGYTYVHAFIDVSLIISIAFFIGFLVSKLA